MDGGGNMLQVLAELSDTRVGMANVLMLPTLTQLPPADPRLHWLDFYTHTYAIAT